MFVHALGSGSDISPAVSIPGAMQQWKPRHLLILAKSAKLNASVSKRLVLISGAGVWQK